MAGVEAVTSKPSHTNSPSALPRRAQTFGLRFSFPNGTETVKQETEQEDEKDEWNKGVTHENNGLHDSKVCTRADAQVSLSNDMSTLYREAYNSNVNQAKRNKSGGYSRGVPPLPIPNREVKPTRADGTAPQCGRVGRRRL